MSRKTLRCYEFEVKKGTIVCKKEFFSSLVSIIFDNTKNENANDLGNGNKLLKFTSEKGEKYSLELINKVDNKKIDVDKDFLFFRIGKQKDIDGFLKRNKTTLLGEEVLDENDQKIYELEVCTYILFELKKGIILEMYGQYAPTFKMLMTIINYNLELIDDFNNLKTYISYNNIMTEKMIETFQTTGKKLGKIGYTYSIPDAKKLEELGLDTKQVQALNMLGGLELEFIIKNRPRLPLTKSSEKISAIVQAFKGCAEEIKENLFFEGSTNANTSQKYTFNEEEVTYNLDVSYYKTEDNIKVALNLDEIQKQVYEKIKNKYDKNKDDLLNYIYKE